MLYFSHFFYSISPCSLSSSLSTSVLSSSHLSETLKLTLTISPETHHLSSSSSQTDAIPAEALPTAVPAANRLNACSPINAASQDPRWHQCCFTRPTPASELLHQTHPASMLPHQTHAGIRATSPDPHQYQCYFTRPTPPIGVLARRSGGFLVIFYFVWSRFYEKN